MSIKSKIKAKRNVARHTKHGLSKIEAKQQHVIASLGTERNYVQANSNYIEWCSLNDIHPDFHSNKKFLEIYLQERSEWVKQKTLNIDRQALQIVYQQQLPFVRSHQITIQDKRSYLLSQVNLIAARQNEKNSLMTKLSFWAGLRAHESATILPLTERSPSQHRSWDHRLFLGFPEHRLYSVIGKGGLVRTVAVPVLLAKELEARRIAPTKVSDRGINYESNYNIGFGQAWSQSFTCASKATLGFSTGGHGLRHSYSKWRLNILIKEIELLNPNLGPDQIYKSALLILSQELGHFRLDIVFAYLR